MFLVGAKSSHHTNDPRNPAHWGDPILQMYVTELLQKKVLPGLDFGRVILKTQAKVDGILFRADPGAVTPRHDWVNVQWSGGHGVIPARIMIFFEIPVNSIISGTSLDDNDRQVVDGNGLFAVISSLDHSLYVSPNPKTLSNVNHQLAHPQSMLLYWSELVHTTRQHRTAHGVVNVPVPTLYLVNVSATFISPVIAIPYNVTGEDNIDPMWWLFIEPRSKWNDIFRGVMKSMIDQVK
jgi:hypothetical protein